MRIAWSSTACRGSAGLFALGMKPTAHSPVCVPRFAKVMAGLCAFTCRVDSSGHALAGHD